MLKAKSIIQVVLIGSLALLPVLADRWLAARDARHSELNLRYECFYEDRMCEADFSGDGIPDRLVIDRANPAPLFDSWVVGLEGSRELFRFPYRYIDNTLRTHVAVRNEAGGARLLVYDGIQQPDRASTPHIRAVYAWGGEKMVEVSPSGADTEILTAMSARDDAGTFMGWVIYRMLRWPVLVAYGLLLVTSAVIYRLFRRPKLKLV